MVIISKKGAVAFLGILAIVVAAGVFIWMAHPGEEGVVQFATTPYGKYPIIRMYCDDPQDIYLCANGDHAFTSRRIRLGADNRDDVIIFDETSIDVNGAIKVCYYKETSNDCGITSPFDCLGGNDGGYEVVCLKNRVSAGQMINYKNGEPTGYIYEGIVGYVFKPFNCDNDKEKVFAFLSLSGGVWSGWTAYANNEHVSLFSAWDKNTKPVMCAFQTQVAGTVLLYSKNSGSDYVLSVGGGADGFQGYSSVNTEGYVFLNDALNPNGHCKDLSCNYGEGAITCPGDCGPCGDGIKQTPNGNGQDEVCDGADGCPSGQTCNAGCTQCVTPSTSHVPAQSGNFDSVTCGDITIPPRANGWTCDLDSPSTPIYIHIYKYNPADQGGEFGKDGIANVNRADLIPNGNPCLNTINHGFEIDLPKEWRGTSFRLYAHGIDTDGYSNFPALSSLGYPYPPGNGPITFNCGYVCGDGIKSPGEKCDTGGNVGCGSGYTCPAGCLSDCVQAPTCQSNTWCNGVCVGSCSETECPGQPNNVNGQCVAACPPGECGGGRFCDCPGCLASANGGDECGSTMHCNRFYDARGTCEKNACTTNGICEVGEACECDDCEINGECGGNPSLSCRNNICQPNIEGCANGQTYCEVNGQFVCTAPSQCTSQTCVNDGDCIFGEGCACQDCRPSNQQYHQDTCETGLVCVGIGNSAHCGQNLGHILSWRTADEGQIDSAVVGQTVRLVYEHPNLQSGKQVTFSIFNIPTGIQIGGNIVNDSSSSGKASVAWTIPNNLNGIFVFRVTTNQAGLNPSGLESNELEVTSHYVGPIAETHNECKNYGTREECEHYSEDVIDSDPLRNQFVCEEEGDCYCKWGEDEEGNEFCGFFGVERIGITDSYGNPISCTITTICGECIDGEQMCTPVVLNGGLDICGENPFPSDCGISLAEMGFFGVWEFVISAIGVAVIYVFIWRRKK